MLIFKMKIKILKSFKDPKLGILKEGEEIEIETIDPIPEKKWTEVTITYDGKGHVNGLNFFINGEKAPTIKKGNELYKSILFKPNIHTYGFNGFRVGPMHKFKTIMIPN